MSINIEVADKVKIKITGSIRNASGVDEKFDFWLICMRLDTDAIQDRLGEDADKSGSVVDFLADVVEDWSGVKSGNDSIPYSEANLRSLCKIPGVSGLAFKTYLDEIGAKAKN